MSEWTPTEWDGFCSLLLNGWPGEFGPENATAYRVLLDGYSPDELRIALTALIARGSRFRPSASELAAEVRRDAGRPTWAEAEQLIFGPRGALAARLPAGGYDSEAAMEAGRDLAALERAESMHPSVLAFLNRQGVRRLRTLEVACPEYGPVRRRELADDWQQMHDAFDERQIAAIVAAGVRAAGELTRMDPLTALGLAEPRAQLAAGGDQGGHS